MEIGVLKNYADGMWVESKTKELLDVHNPATDELIARVPMSTAGEVDKIIQAAMTAFQDWRETTP